MPKLPLTVTAVVPLKSALYEVQVAFADGTTANYIIPETMATVEAVRISALAYGQLAGIVAPSPYPHYRKHRRYASRA